MTKIRQDSVCITGGASGEEFAWMAAYRRGVAVQKKGLHQCNTPISAEMICAGRAGLETTGTSGHSPATNMGG